MNRVVPAAQQLISQVREHRPDMTWEPGELDGYQMVRAIRFDTDTSNWLRPILAAIDDPRIATCTADEQMTVEFIGNTRADWRDPYPLGIVAKVLYGEEPVD